MWTETLGAPGSLETPFSIYTAASGERFLQAAGWSWAVWQVAFPYL